MAFLSKVGNILKQTASRQINSELSASRPSIYQAIRWMSSSKVFVGGISYATDDTSLREAFSKYGEVIEARIILDRETGRSRGFGFVTYTSSEEASSAIQALDGQDLHGRRVRVNYANDRARGGGYGGGGGGYGGGGYGGYNNNSNNYGGNYGGQGGNYGGGSTEGNVGYAAGNSFDSTRSGANGSGNWNYGSGADGIADGNTNESGAGSFGVTGGGSDMGGGYDGNVGLGHSSGGNEFGDHESGSLDAEAGGYDQGEPLEGNFRDDDDADDFAKRA